MRYVRENEIERTDVYEREHERSEIGARGGERVKGRVNVREMRCE